jgi:hypothetical protein
MKRFLIVSGLTCWAGIALLRAQDASTIADRQAVEERYQQLVGKVQDLAETQQAQAKRIDALTEELRLVRTELGKPNADLVQRDELRKLAEQVKEIDTKREDDKNLILSEIKKLGKTTAVSGGKPIVKSKPDNNVDPGANKSADKTADTNYEGFEHTVKSGETLIAIIQAYNKENSLKLTVDQVLKHPINAGVKPEKLRVGQKIFIPAK